MNITSNYFSIYNDIMTSDSLSITNKNTSYYKYHLRTKKELNLRLGPRSSFRPVYFYFQNDVMWPPSLT